MDDRESLIPAKHSSSIQQPHIVAASKKRKPFITAKSREEDEDAVDQIDENRHNKVLILNQSKCNRIVKFPCTIGEANELLMRQLVTVKFSFNSLPRNGPEEERAKDHNGNYDVLPLISPEDLKVPPSINNHKLQVLSAKVPAQVDSRSINICKDRETMIARELELNEENFGHSQRIAKQDQFDEVILYQKFRQTSGHPMIGTMIVHQFITVAEISPTKGYLKLCQICHTPLRSSSTIKCVHCDFKCHSHCQNKVSTYLYYYSRSLMCDKS